MKPRISVVIISYNTAKLTLDCLSSLFETDREVSFEVIVSDNGSTDSSVEMIKERFSFVRLIENGGNIGFAAGNNKARKYCSGKYVLFLNSDTIVPRGVLKASAEYLEKHGEVGILTCKMKVPSGGYDKDARRSFPTPWVALSHMMGLDKLFPKSRVFSKYWYGYISPNVLHEVDVAQGAYAFCRKKVLDEVGWFDEDYFLDGEDIDLSWRVKNAGYKVVYNPKIEITHVKKGSKLRLERSERLKIRLAGVYSMELFYKKHLSSKYPKVLNLLVLFALKIVKLGREIKVFVT